MAKIIRRTYNINVRFRFTNGAESTQINTSVGLETDDPGKDFSADNVFEGIQETIEACIKRDHPDETGELEFAEVFNICRITNGPRIESERLKRAK